MFIVIAISFNIVFIKHIGELTPVQFREILKRTFNLKFTLKELGALIEHFSVDDDDDDEEHTKIKIDSKQFLNHFIKVWLILNSSKST
jgi:hypothetical protein